jgi:hypothetical protein
VFTTAYANRLVRVYTPLLKRINALDWQALTPATRAALRASMTRFETFQQQHPKRPATNADVMASCREAEAILTELTETLDAMNGGRS